jgi:hypothetical protein
MRHRVRLYFERGLSRGCLHDIKDFFEKFPGPVSVECDTRPIDLSTTGGILNWEDIWEVTRELRHSENLSDDEFVFVISNTPNEANWFSAEDPSNPRNAFGHIEDFSWVTHAPAYVIATHYILKTIFHSYSVQAGLDPLVFMHMEPRSCFYDFCGTKTELDFKLKSADICGDCLKLFSDVGISEELLKQAVNLIEASRKEVISTTALMPSVATFEGWPYPVAITRHKAQHVRNDTYRCNLLLDHLDSLVRYLCIVNLATADSEVELPDRPSLGTWVSILRGSLRTRNDPLKRVVDIIERNGLVSFRNEIAHGYSSISPQKVRENVDFLHNQLSNIERAADTFLRTYQLLIPTHFSVVGGKDIVACKHLLGSHNIHPLLDVQLDISPNEAGIKDVDQVYVQHVGEPNRMWSLHPHLQERECPECKHERMLITDGNGVYIDVYMGHRIELPV